MYDIEIVVPAELEFKQRFIDFKNHGILNIGNTKIKLVLLVSNDNSEESIKELEDGWPKEIEDVSIVRTPYKHVAQRIYYYYDSIIDPNSARWFMRIDEDSINDISGLMKNLEDLFDPDRDHHLTGQLCYDLYELEMHVMKSLGFHHWYEHAATVPPHEHEISITSQAAMKRIFSNETAKRYFNLRKDIKGGYGDHGLCLCARMTKIHPTIASFLTVKSEIVNFSTFGGCRNHIYWISRDRSPLILEWLDGIDYKKSLDLKTKVYSMRRINTNQKGLVKFCEDGRVEEVFTNKPSVKIGIWKINKENKISIFFNEQIEKRTPLLNFDINNEDDSFYSSICSGYELRTGLIDDVFN
jgi:hypothetical protein